MSLLETHNLGVGYTIPGAGLFGATRLLPIVHDVSLTLAPGRTLGVVGESGCGKSTLGRALLRLIPPSEGQVLWQGEDMAHIPDLRRRRAEMQIIFQDPVAALDPRMTLGRIVSRPLATFEPEPDSRATPAPARSRPCNKSAFPPISPTATRMNCPADRRSASASPAPSSAGRR